LPDGFAATLLAGVPGLRFSGFKKAARSDPVLAAEGAALFLEKVSPALERGRNPIPILRWA